VVHLPFPTRKDAGAKLAESLTTYANTKDTLILGLVRGGIVIGRALAEALHLPLYPYVVRKLGHPFHREFGLGAIAEGGETYLDEAMMKLQGVSWDEMEPIIEEELGELKRRVEMYKVHPRPPLNGKTVILTDDGAATGGTMFAAIQDMRKAKVKKVVVALPVSPLDTAETFKKKADEVIILATPEPFEAVGKWYKDFQQVEDDEVVSLLQSIEVPLVH